MKFIRATKEFKTNCGDTVKKHATAPIRRNNRIIFREEDVQTAPPVGLPIYDGIGEDWPVEKLDTDIMPKEQLPLYLGLHPNLDRDIEEKMKS